MLQLCGCTGSLEAEADLSDLMPLSLRYNIQLAKYAAVILTETV